MSIPNPVLLLAFGFTNLAMLGWLAAAAAPLLIHLWSRHRFREAPWAAMQFLLAAMRKNARRLWLQQWLLLAVRTLVVALVVFAVAEPYGERLMAGGGASPTHKILVIDSSYSMALQGADGTLFERAKRLAADFVRDSRSGDGFTVIQMTATPQTMLGREVIDHAAIVRQIESLPQSHSGVDLDLTLTLVDEALEQKKGTAQGAVQQEVYFFTDLQRSTWAVLSDSHAEHGNNEGLKERVVAITRHATVTVIDVGEVQASNLAVSNVTTAESFITPGREVEIGVTLQQHGPEPRPQCNVELLVDDVPVGEQSVDVPANGSAAVRFTHRFQTPGSHAVAVRAAGDRLDIDNSRYLVVPVRDAVRVLCIAGREGAAKYLGDALNPNPAGDSAIEPVIVSEGDLAELEFSDFDCIFLCNVAQLTPGEGERLVRYAKAGGGLVVFLGDRIVPESYQAISPAGIGESVVTTQFGLDPLEYRHPIVAPFRGRERAGLLTTPVTRYFRLTVPQDRLDAEVAATTSSGDPFIVATPLGRGRTLVVATDCSLASVDPETGESWTTWPTWPSFLPIVQELLAYAVRGQQTRWQLLVGSPIVATELASRGVPAPGPNNLRILRPDGRSASASVQSKPTGSEWTYNDTDVSGIYSLQELPPGEAMQFAVNVDTAESDLEKAAPDQLPSKLIVHESPGGTAAAGGSDVVAKASWNESLLWMVVALLFTESFMAWRFGRGAA